MSTIYKQISTFSKRSIEWTGTLERIVREFLEAGEIALSEAETDAVCSMPERLVDLVQAGVLHAVELRAGQDALCIEFPSDPDIEDELDLSMLMLCDLSGEQLEFDLVISEPEVAKSLGAEMLTELSSEKLVVSLCVAEIGKFFSKPVGTSEGEQESENKRESQL